MIKEVDNFDILAEKLFETPLDKDEYYLVHLLLRAKDGHKVNGSNIHRTVKYYIVKSARELLALKPEIVSIVNGLHCRAYIYPQARSFKSTANEALLGMTHAYIDKLYSKILVNLKFREDLSMNEDVIFSLTAASSADTISIIPNIVYLYRIQNEDSLSLKFNKDYCTSLDDIDDILTKNQKGDLRRGIKRWIMGYMFIYLRKCCRINVSVEEKVKLLKEATSCKVFKKYATIGVADTMNKKISTLLLKIGVYKKYIKLVNGKGE